MANGKTIKGYASKAELNNDDAFLFQRNNEYFYVNAQSIASGSVVNDTRSNINSIRTAGNLSTNAVYYGTDSYIYAHATSTSTIDSNALFLARVGDYNSSGVYSGITIANGFSVTATGTNLGVWTVSLTPSSGDVVIWNNLHWLNITGANGATDPTTDVTNWESVTNTDIQTAFTYGYIKEIDPILYDFESNVVLRRYDKRNNDIGVNAIDTFQWGNNNVKGNTIVGETTYDNENQTGTDSNNTLTYGSSVDYAIKTIDIGDWDMDADTTKIIFHGLSVTEWQTIRSISVIIRNDVDAIYYKLESLIDVDGYLAGGVQSFTSTKILLNRRLLGFFDSVDFDSTSYNRGWVTVQYTAD